MRIPLGQFVFENADLGMLTAETEDRCASDIGMIDVSGEQSAKRIRILSSAPAAKAMFEEFHAVHEREKRDRFGIFVKIQRCGFDVLPSCAAFLQFG